MTVWLDNSFFYYVFLEKENILKTEEGKKTTRLFAFGGINVLVLFEKCIVEAVRLSKFFVEKENK
jgi:hypothetical protein